jgi:hypothetical protein
VDNKDKIRGQDHGDRILEQDQGIGSRGQDLGT